MNEADRTEGFRLLDVADAANNAVGKALKEVENWIRALTVDTGTTPPPVELPQPGKPPGAMLPGQLTIPQCSTDDKLFLSNANPSVVNLSKLYASDQDIAVMYAYYNIGGRGYPLTGFNASNYAGVFRR